MSTHKVGQTAKGSRVWLQNLSRYRCRRHTPRGWAEGQHYSLKVNKQTIVITADPEGRKRVSKHKGGIIDLTGKWVTEWAQGCTEVTVTFTEGRIEIRKVAP